MPAPLPTKIPSDVKQVLPLERQKIPKVDPNWTVIATGDLERMEGLRAKMDGQKGPELILHSLFNAYMLGFAGSYLFNWVRSIKNIRTSH